MGSEADARTEELDLENTVVELEKINQIIFPPTDKLSADFLVVDNILFANNYYGNLEVYNLNSGSKISELHFRPIELRNIATDGNYLYLNIKKDFELRKSDILLAKLPKDAHEFDFIEFVGKPLNEIKEINWEGKSNQQGIESKIVSFPLNAVYYDSIVYSPDMLTDEYTRFLVHQDMGINIYLTSNNGYITINYRSGFDDIPQTSSIFLKNGELYDLKKDELEKIEKEQDSKRKTPKEVRIIDLSNELHASYDTTYWEDLEEKGDCTTLNIIYKKGHPPKQHNILKLIHNDDLIHVLYDQVSHSPKAGIININSPSILETYKVSLRELKTTA